MTRIIKNFARHLLKKDIYIPSFMIVNRKRPKKAVAPRFLKDAAPPSFLAPARSKIFGMAGPEKETANGVPLPCKRGNSELEYFKGRPNSVIKMLSPEQEKYILENAYVPEHITHLMVGISGGEPFCIENYVLYARADWLIFIGYPLRRHYQAADFTATLNDTIKKFNPAYTWFIVPEMPESFLRTARQRESDEYYKLDIQNQTVKKNLVPVIQKAATFLKVEKRRQFSLDHVTLTKEFLKREKTAPRVRELFLHMPQYIAISPTSRVLSARDRNGNLSAFYVIELGAVKFATYVVGCFSKRHYVAHASDLLFFEMINLAREDHKEYIHLGLGVNEGIRRFKKKWGGTPSLKYEFGELYAGREEPLPWLQVLDTQL